MRLRSRGRTLNVSLCVLLCSLMLLLGACGGGGGGGSPTPENSVTVSGTVTYEFVPSNEDFIGLDYSAIETRPVRGAVVELVNSTNTPVAITATDNNGFYSVAVEANTVLRVQVKAQLQRNQAPSWNMTVNDNTNNDRLYALVGSEASVGGTDSQRNLHAPSDWNSGNYATSRPAAPFAILDAVYTSLQQFVDAGYAGNFPPLQLFWSVSNITADGDPDRGEIGTSYYFDNEIYILGEADQDTDEFDSHVIVHEWGHYIEDALARSDSIGGPHQYGDYLDMRVAFSEGFGNAFAAMMLDDPIYRDSIGFNQSNSFMYDVREKNHPVRGWYSEASVESVLYNYFLSSANKTAKDFSPILSTLTDGSYYNADSLATIFLFAERLVARYPAHRNVLEGLLEEQDINSVNQYANGETNSGGNSINLPIYKSLSIGGTSTSVCSTSEHTDYNKLGVNQFLRLSITQSGNYIVRIERSGGDFVTQSDPDFFIHSRGEIIHEGASSANDVELQTVALDSGNYIVEIIDYANVGRSSNVTTCFNVFIARQ
ncbi:hypothetical protein ACSV5M_04435 [Cellvibrio sp. ARAG 10.3]|uniref:hypothetical protein n=1 Tax=Cellvibrio sp. ARAG 10.3 TaxID=3451358 RepID=UPI003F476883